MVRLFFLLVAGEGFGSLSARRTGAHRLSADRHTSVWLSLVVNQLPRCFKYILIIDKRKSLTIRVGLFLLLVAGEGFEPTTFRL